MPKTSRSALRKTEEDSSLFPIRTVATLTGVNTATLRAWERRYGLIRPSRTDAGHRLYNQSQIDQIHRIVVLLDRGIPISRVRPTLESSSETDTAAETRANPWRRYLDRMVSAIVRFDEEALDDTYNETLSLYPIDIVTRYLLLPLLTDLGRRWETTEGSVAEEHFFGVYLRNKLGARFHHRPRGNTGPRLLVACLPDELHEIGALLFSLAAHERGYRIVLLGANTPLDDLPAVVRRAGIDFVVLSGSLEPAPDFWRTALARLVASAGAPIGIGGLASVKHRDAVVAAGALPLGADIEHGLRRLREKTGVVTP